MPAGFSNKRDSEINADDDQSRLIDKLYRQIGSYPQNEHGSINLKCLSSEQRKSLINESCSLSIPRQCQLPRLSRINLYYSPKQISEAELAVANKIDVCDSWTSFHFFRTLFSS